MTVRYLGATRTLYKPLGGLSALVQGECYDADQNISLRRMVGVYPSLFEILPDSVEAASSEPVQPEVPAQPEEDTVPKSRFKKPADPESDPKVTV